MVSCSPAFLTRTVRRRFKPGSLERSGNVTVRGATCKPGKRRLRTTR
jgi:hypothetical protein